MYASVTTAQIKPGKLNEATTIYNKSLLPMVRELSGIKDFYVLANSETNQSITIAIYETEADAERTQSSGIYQKAVGMLVGTFVPESLVREGYEVTVHL